MDVGDTFWIIYKNNQIHQASCVKVQSTSNCCEFQRVFSKFKTEDLKLIIRAFDCPFLSAMVCHSRHFKRKTTGFRQ